MFYRSSVGYYQKHFVRMFSGCTGIRLVIEIHILDICYVRYFRSSVCYCEDNFVRVFSGCTGVLLIIVVNILFVFATQTARRYIFNLFWITHKLFIILYILTLIHGASNLVQKPLFLSYFIGPIVLYTMDKIVSLSRKKTQLSIIRAENLPSGVSSFLLYLFWSRYMVFSFINTVFFAVCNTVLF